MRLIDRLDYPDTLTVTKVAGEARLKEMSERRIQMSPATIP